MPTLPHGALLVSHFNYRLKATEWKTDAETKHVAAAELQLKLNCPA